MSDQLSVGANVQLDEQSTTLEEAFMRCAKENSAEGGMNIPMIHFQQGARSLLQGVFAVNFITRYFDSKSAPKRASISEAEKAINRPLLDDHVKGISNY